jgi:hypothetical protein
MHNLGFSRSRSPIVSSSRPQIGNRYGAASALVDVVSFYPASPKDAKKAAILAADCRGSV